MAVGAGMAAFREMCESLFPDLFSPLALDLDGDGVEADGQALFDHAGDGMAEASNWVSEDDGLLAWDRDGNGLIDSGRELFGDSTPLPAGGQASHGFAALASLDSNGDGVVDAKDAKWSELRVLRWTDANKNGWMDKGEQRLEKLAQHGISSLSLAYTASTKKDAAGNEHRQAGSYTKTDGSTRSMVDVWFRADLRLRSYDKSAVPAHSAAVKALPDARGFGLVYDLRDAMALDAAGKLAAPLYAGKERTETRTLAQLVKAFGAAETEAARAELLDKILLRWAGAEGVTHADYGWRRRLDYTTAARFAVVEAFEGRKITKGDDYRNPAAGLGQWINRRYRAVSEHLRAELVLQQSYASELGTLKVKLGTRELATQEALEKLTESERGKLYLDFTAARQSLAKRGAAATAEFVRSLAATFGASDMVLRGLEQTAPGWQYRYEYQVAWLSASVSEGEYLRSNDYHGDDKANVFRTVDGGADTLRGGKGSDLYQLQAGTGHDTVHEAADAALPACGCPTKVAAAKKGNSDIVMLGPDVAVADVRLRRDRDHLWVEILGPADAKGARAVTDSLKIHNHYRGTGIEGVVFADGTEWNRQKLAATPFTGGSGNDRLVGRDGQADVFDSSAGGNDSLYGLGGDDTYVLRRGTGHDAVFEGRDSAGRVMRSGAGGTDRVLLGTGITAADVRMRRDGDHLLIELLGAAGTDGVRPVTDSMRIDGYFLSSSTRVESVEFADGTKWGEAKLAKAAFMGGSGNDKIVGRASAADIFDSAAGGSDSLYGLGGDDTYILRRGTGHDTVFEGRDSGGTWQGDRRGASGTDRVLLGAGITAADVRLRRDGVHLVIELLGAVDAEGVRPVTDSLKVDSYFIDATMRVEAVEFADGSKWAAAKLDAVALVGGSGRDKLVGSRGADTFDSAAGGNDSLYGQDGGDTYVLRRGTGHDTVYEGRDSRGSWQLRRGFGGTDRVLLGSGIGTADVRLRRDGVHLVIELLGAADADGVRPVTDSLRIDSHYAGAQARIEKVEFADGTVWGAARFNAADLPGASEAVPPSYTQATEPMRGDTRNDHLHGRADRNDIFDADAGGNDSLYGKDGDDVYRLGSGTGHDVVNEHYRRSSAVGDANDVVEIEAGFKAGDVQLRRDANHLYIQLLGPADENGVRSVTDSLKIDQHYNLAAGEIEKVKFADGTVWTAVQFDQVAIRGGGGNEYLHGRTDMADIFDADAGGNDSLYGKDGDDVYRLGSGTGHDVVYEHYQRSSAVGDANDVVEIEAGFKPGDVQLRRDTNHLYIQLLGKADKNGVRSVTDSLKIDHYYALATAEVEKVKFADGTAWTAAQFDKVAIRGGAGNEHLHGRADMADVFDADAGGNDHLYGKDGDDIYRLGSGTGHDVVYEHYQRSSAVGDANDVVEIEAGFKPGDVQLRRDTNHLYIQLLGKADKNGVRSVTDSLKIDHYYALATAEVEKVKFADGTAWTAAQFDKVAIRGGAGNEHLHGRADMADVFDADAGGNDHLYGKDGDDIYRLGSGTGHDVVNEHYQRSSAGGDANDVVEIEAGFKAGDVQLRRDTNHLYIQLLGAADASGVRSVTDSLKIDRHYDTAAGEIEKITFTDGTAWTAAQFDKVAIRGGAGNEHLHGRADMADVFDADAGGNDHLYGKDGDDIYRLGSGTGHDVVNEHYQRSSAGGDANDVVEIEAGFKAGDVQLRRDTNHLYIQLLGAADASGVRSVTDSLKIDRHYDTAAGEIEKITFTDGTAWTAAQFDKVAIRGGAGNEHLHGRADMADVFDADAGGNDHLYGKDGDDIYRLGSGTGHDVVNEHYQRSSAGGDANDVVEIEAGFKASDVQLRRDTNHLYIQLLGPADKNGVRSVTDSLKIDRHYDTAAGEIEKVKFADGTAWTAAQFDKVAIRGGAGNEHLHGRADMADVFDADAGGNDHLYGKDGDDIYRLGSGTGHDVVNEHSQRSSKAGDTGDVVEIEAGFKAGDVQLRRDTDHLYIQLLGKADKNGVRSVTDSLKIDRHYSHAAGAIESIKFAGGKEWQGPLAVGGSGADTLSSAQAGVLYGGAGNDVYQLSGSFGQDTIIDTGGADKLSFTGHAKEKLSLSRAGDDLVVKSLGSSNQVTIDGWYEQGGARRLERIESGTEVLLASAAERMVAAMAVFVDAGGSESSFLATKAADYWQAIDIGQ